METRFESTKSHFCNSLNKFYTKETELVRKLNFFDPKDSTNFFFYRPTRENKDTKKTVSSFLPMIVEKKKRIIQRSVKIKPKISTLFATSNSDKAENTNLEDRLEGERRLILHDMDEHNKRLNKVLHRILNSSGFIQECRTFIKASQNDIKLKQEYINQGRSTKFRTAQERNEFFEEENLLIKEIHRTQAENEEMETEIKVQEAELVKLRRLKTDIEKRIARYAEKHLNIKSRLNEHYHRILNKGTDTRSEGIIWVIKAIYKLGENVILSCLPSFLDENAIKYVFEVCF